MCWTAQDTKGQDIRGVCTFAHSRPHPPKHPPSTQTPLPWPRAHLPIRRCSRNPGGRSYHFPSPAGRTLGGTCSRRLRWPGDGLEIVASFPFILYGRSLPIQRLSRFYSATSAHRHCPFLPPLALHRLLFLFYSIKYSILITEGRREGGRRSGEAEAPGKEGATEVSMCLCCRLITEPRKVGTTKAREVAWQQQHSSTSSYLPAWCPVASGVRSDIGWTEAEVGRGSSRAWGCGLRPRPRAV